MSTYTHLKSDLDPDCEHLNFDAIRTEVYRHREYSIFIGESNYTDRLPPLLNPYFYSLDGSLVTSINAFNKFAPAFFRRSRRTVECRNMVHLRGGRYIISSNPTFEVRQKLITYEEDLDEGLDAFRLCSQPFYKAAIADYIKNAVITMLNAFLNEEKNGKYRFTHIGYQSLRHDAQEYGQAAVDFFYGALLEDHELTNNAYKILVAKREVFNKIQEHIVDEYQRGVFSSRHISRPEASHPLIIATAVQMYATDSTAPIPKIIIGLPSGSTELALAYATGQRYLKKNQCKVLLFPVSIHSAKNDFDNFKVNSNHLTRWAKHHGREIKKQNLLIVDDNSSTGKTIQLVVDSILPMKPSSLNVVIAEADIVRSELDLLNKSRPNIADAALYKYSTNVLPVSRTLAPKTDLKELLERRKMIACTKSRYQTESHPLNDSLVGLVYQDMLETPTEKVLAERSPDKIERQFRKSFLSNFYPVEVFHSGQRFESVEHAYQAMKFEPGTWAKITEKDVQYINRRLSDRKAHISMEQLPVMFTLPEITAGTSKIAANSLRILGYVRSDWDHVKASIMAELLLQKFANIHLWNLLSDTNDIYLIEGNDWNDTYWGECNGRGRNVLGRMLMFIRNMELNLVKKEAVRLSHLHRPNK